MSYYRQQPGWSDLPPVAKNLIIINVLVLLASMVFDKTYGLTDKLALHPVDSPNFKPYQLVTHMFTHGGFLHLLFNMLGLFIFGLSLENMWGSKRFFLFYMVTGLGAAALHLLVQHLRLSGYNDFEISLMKMLAGEEHKYTPVMVPTVGASGAIMGLLAGFAYLFPNTPLMVFPIPVPIKAIYFALIYMAIDLFGGIANQSTDNVAHFAHLGGGITGFILVFIWNRTNRRNFY